MNDFIVLILIGFVCAVGFALVLFIGMIHYLQ
jgi:hypothetical protein